PYIRPGFLLSKMIAEGVQNNPKAELVIMEKHGLVTWGETSKESYDKTIEIINEAESYIEKQAESIQIFGGEKYTSLSEEQRKEIFAEIMPIVRGQVSQDKRMLVTYDDDSEVLRFVNSHHAQELSQVGAACPDHLVHTKRVPLFVEWDPQTGDREELIEKLKTGLDTFKQEYVEYFERNKEEGDVMMETAPRIILIPGLGMLNTGKSWSAANVSEQLYHRAIAVMRGATVLGNFVSLNEEESFQIEYWPLELYKLSLAPPEAEFSRQVAFVTGGAGGIGTATIHRLVDEGAHAVIADINLEGAQKLADEINEKYGQNRAIAVKMDVTQEEKVKKAIKASVLAYGGLDILVNNAGLASSSPFEDTSMEQWNL